MSTFNKSMLFAERLRGDPYGVNSDIWAFGLSIFTCAIGDFPIKYTGGFWGLFNYLQVSFQNAIIRFVGTDVGFVAAGRGASSAAS
jgi:hypothetical protein